MLATFFERIGVILMVGAFFALAMDLHLLAGGLAVMAIIISPN